MAGDVVATVIRDANANGVADSGEPGIAGVTIYVDSDGSATLGSAALVMRSVRVFVRVEYSSRT